MRKQGRKETKEKSSEVDGLGVQQYQRKETKEESSEVDGLGVQQYQLLVFEFWVINKFQFLIKLSIMPRIIGFLGI